MTKEQMEIFIEFVLPVWEEALVNAGYPFLMPTPIDPSRLDKIDLQYWGVSA